MSYNYKIRKYAQQMEPTGSPPPYWSKIKDELMKVPSLSSDIKSILSSVDKIVFNTKAPDGEPNAIAYVSSGDANENNKPDKIHFVLPNMPPSITDEQFAGFLQQIESVLVHENAHIKDYNVMTGEFPGGEGAAESAEHAFKPELPSDMKVASHYKKIKDILFSNDNSFRVRR